VEQGDSLLTIVSLGIVAYHCDPLSPLQIHSYSKTKSSNRIRNNNLAIKGKEKQQKAIEIRANSIYTA
jgi:hypothetical protein